MVGGWAMNREDFEEFIRRNPEEAMWLIAKAFKEKELLRIGNRSYLNAFKHPESYFDIKELMPDGGSLQVLNSDMLQPLRDPLRLFTDQVVIPPSYLIFKDDAGNVYARNGMIGQIDFSGTDAATVIQQAINALPAGGMIFIKAGTYSITQAIVDNGHNYVEISGEGRNTILKVANGVATSVFKIWYRTSWVIRDLVIDGNKANVPAITPAPPADYNGTQNGINLRGTTYSKILNVEVRNTKYHGIVLWDSSNFNEVRGCYIHDNGDDTSTYKETGGLLIFMNSQNNVVQGNVSAYNFRRQFYISNGSARNVIVGNIAVGGVYTAGATVGIPLYDGVENSVVVGNLILGDGTHPTFGIHLGEYQGVKARYNLVANNVIYKPGQYGIYTSGDDYYNEIMGNYIYSPGSVGIEVGRNDVAIGNRVYGAVNQGIVVHTGGAYVINNYVEGSRTGIFLLNATNTLVRGNMVLNNTSWGIREYGTCDYNTIIENVLINNPTPIVRLGANTVIKRNIGYATEASGVATISAGSTRVTVSHGLATTPTKVLITPLSQPPGKLWAENIGSTSFDIVTDTAPSSNLNVAWYAEV
jgi:parallel beta-helix repeat protein